eukprot:3495853-Karenia_brevis.AAC.1
MKGMRRQMEIYLQESQMKKEKEKRLKVKEKVGEGVGQERVVFVNVRDKAPRSFKITKEDIDNHGQTPG